MRSACDGAATLRPRPSEIEGAPTAERHVGGRTSTDGLVNGRCRPDYPWCVTLLRRYWGYGLLVVLVFLLINRQWDPTVVLVLAGGAAIYFFFQVPVWCGADTRDGK